MAYDTPLSPQEEQQFQGWKSRYAPNDSGADYDLRGAFKAGLTPSQNGHWPDTFKKPNHPTFSDESIYAKNAPNMAGHWNGDTYVKPPMASTATAFDPDAYLAQRMGAAQPANASGPATTGFDPNAYLKARGPAAVAAPPIAAPAAPIPASAPPLTSPFLTPEMTGLRQEWNTPGLTAAERLGIMVAGMGRKGVNMVETAGIRGVPTALGQIAGQRLAGPIGARVGGAAGAAVGDVADQFRLMANGSQPGFSWGQLGGDMLAGAFPGRSPIGVSPSGMVARGAGAAGVNVAATNAQSLIDRGTFAGAGQNLDAAALGFASPFLAKGVGAALGSDAEAANAAGRDAFRKQTLAQGRAMGLVVPPSAVNPNPVNNTLQSIAGKAAVAQAAMEQNAPKIDNAIMDEIGLPKDSPLSPAALNTARVGPNLVYAKVAASNPAAPGLIESWKQANSDSNQLWNEYKNSLDPSVKTAAQASDARADALHTSLEQVTPPDLIDQLKGARVQLGKIGLASRALNKGGAGFDPAVIGGEYDASPNKLTGAFATVGRFENAFGKYVREASEIPPSGVDWLKTVAKFGASGVGYNFGGVPGAVAGGLGAMGAESGIRKTLLSMPFQKVAVNPNYGSAITAIPAPAAAQAAMAAGRDDQPLTEDEYQRLQELRSRLNK